MSIHTIAPRSTEPVINAGAVTSAVVTLTSAAATLAVLFGVDLTYSETAVTAVTGSVVTLINALVPLVQMMRTRALVTPIAAPRDDAGHPLVPSGSGL